MKVIVSWYKEAVAKGHTDYILEVGDFAFDTPRSPDDRERRKVEQYAADVVRQTLTHITGFRPVVTPMRGEDRTMPPEGSPHWRKTVAPKGINEVD